MSQTNPRILIIDADPSAGQQVAMALDAAGIQQAFCLFDGPNIAGKLRTFRPTMLWLHTELNSAGMSRVFAMLERNVELAATPIVLMCEDTKDAGLVRNLRTGVVEILQPPFSPRLHVPRLRFLPRELPERSGEIKGKGSARELTALLQHVVRGHRTGALIINEGLPTEGSATFVNGVLQSASFGGVSGQKAIAALGSLGQASWHFIEGGDGNSAFVELGADGQGPTHDEPMVIEGQSEPLVVQGQVEDDQPEPVVSELPHELELESAAPTARVPMLAEAPTRPATPVVDTGEQAPDAASTPVLFVDDDPALANLLSTYFAKKGYPVEVASDGVEAMQKLLRGRFDIVIADLNMPRLDGWGLLRVIREDARTSETPVALFSSQDDYRERMRATHAGAQAYYSKALRMNALELQVRELLEPRRRFVRLVNSGQSVMTNLSSLGPQWILRQLGKMRLTGVLDALDSWASYRLHFVSGQLAHATARAGAQTLAPDQALMAFLGSKGAEGSLAFNTGAAPSSFGNRPTDELLQHAAAVMNDQKKRLRDEVQAEAKQLEVNRDLYQLYVNVGPPANRAIAQLLCEAKMLPRDVMARLGVSAADVAAVFNDLLLRGVATLKT